MDVPEETTIGLIPPVKHHLMLGSSRLVSDLKDKENKSTPMVEYSGLVFNDPTHHRISAIRILTQTVIVD